MSGGIPEAKTIAFSCFFDAQTLRIAVKILWKDFLEILCIFFVWTLSGWAWSLGWLGLEPGKPWTLTPLSSLSNLLIFIDFL